MDRIYGKVTKVSRHGAGTLVVVEGMYEGKTVSQEMWFDEKEARELARKLLQAEVSRESEEVK